MIFIINKLFDYSSQCQYLQLKKPSDFEIELPIQNTLAISLLKGMAKRTPPPGSDRVNRSGRSGSVIDILFENKQLSY